MSIFDHQLDPEPDFTECPFHHWVYPLGGICQACVRDVNDEYADQAVEDAKFR